MLYCVGRMLMDDPRITVKQLLIRFSRNEMIVLNLTMK